MGDEAVFEEVLAASAILDEMPDMSRADAWGSSALGLWADKPESEAIDREFLAWLEASDAAGSNRLALVVSRLLHPSSGQVRATQAWSVLVDDMISIGVGFAAEDGSEHSLLADVADGRLLSLVAAPPPSELFGFLEGEVEPRPEDVRATCQAIADGWDGLVRAGESPTEETLANVALGRARLGVVLEGGASFGRVPGSMTEPWQMPEADPGLDAWAVGVLDGAAVGAGSDPHELVMAPLDPSTWGDFSNEEREAFGALEWAVWLGAAIQLHRSNPGTTVDPAVLVDMVNRCPEVTSSIPKSDRSYYEWAFSLVISLWVEAGLLARDGTLSVGGSDQLIGALRRRWSTT